MAIEIMNRVNPFARQLANNGMAPAQDSFQGKKATANRPAVGAYEKSVDAAFAFGTVTKAAAPKIEPGHDLGNATGTNIEMKCYDHSLAGAINGATAFIFFNEHSATSELTMRKYGERIKAEFKKDEQGNITGVIKSGEGEEARQTTVQFAGLDAEKKELTYLINGEEHVVKMTADGVNNGHFRNPTYSTTIDGKPMNYRIEVEGCFGYSIYMGMAMLGAYVH